jgi:hypothetical protein
MSSNELNFDKSNQMLQSERNCVNFDGSKRFNVNYKAMNHDDKCFLDIDTRQSIGPGNYQIYSPFDCECMMPQTVKNATDNVAVPVGRNGVDVGACVISDSTALRVGKVKAWPKCPQQLFERPYKTVAYMGRGYLRPDEESELKFAEDTRVKKSCNTLSGISVPQIWTPLVPHLEYNIQRIEHLQTEANDPAWRWGGANTRNIVTDYDYSSKCGKAYMNPSTNAWFWQNNKGQLLQNQ